MQTGLGVFQRTGGAWLAGAYRRARSLLWAAARLLSDPLTAARAQLAKSSLLLKKRTAALTASSSQTHHLPPRQFDVRNGSSCRPEANGHGRPPASRALCCPPRIRDPAAPAPPACDQQAPSRVIALAVDRAPCLPQHLPPRLCRQCCAQEEEGLPPLALALALDLGVRHRWCWLHWLWNL